MRQIKSKTELPGLIQDVCMHLLGHANKAEVSLLLGTAAVESFFSYRKQIGGGPARGLWQMEVATARDIFENYLEYRPELRDKLIRLWLDLDTIPFWVPTDNDIERHLESSDDFGCGMARLKYLRDPDRIPETVVGQSEYWKRVYNTPQGKGTAVKYREAWIACGCDSLLGTLFPEMA